MASLNPGFKQASVQRKRAELDLTRILDYPDSLSEYEKESGRPRVIVDASRVAALRARGKSWSQVQAELGMSKGTVQRAFAALPKIV
jgi:AraC-like DNA-binding protein